MSKKEIKTRLDIQRKNLNMVRKSMDIVDIVDYLNESITKLNNKLIESTGKK